jgi:hypothetical protein
MILSVHVLSAHGVGAQSPFFCADRPNHGFDCVEHPDIFQEGTTVCPDPAVEPWCACLKTYSSSAAPNDHPTITQEVLYLRHQPTAGDYFVDVSGGTLDLSIVSIGDVVFDFLVCVDKDVIGQPLPFKLDFEAIVVAKDASSADVEMTLPPDTDNPVNDGVLGYNPVDEAHSFGKTYVGRLLSRGPGKGFSFEYHLYQPDPLSVSPLRGIEDGDLGRPGFTVESLLTLADKDLGLYTSPACGKVTVVTTIMPLTPGAPVEQKDFAEELTFGGGDFTVGIAGSASATVGDTVLLTATTSVSPPPTYAWAVKSGAANLVDNHDGTASVTAGAEGGVTVELTATSCGTSKTADITITYSAGGVGPFIRGDCNGDGKVTGQVGDAIFLLNFNFLGGTAPSCQAACDSNGDGQFSGQVGDAVYLLNFNFLGGRPPPAPFPDCGSGTSEGDKALGCTDAKGCAP